MLLIIATSFTAIAIFSLWLVFRQHRAVKITINDEHAISVTPGNSLLFTLAHEKIFLPSACSGGGTCALCKCVVKSGGGKLLPIEIAGLSQQERKDHVRLSCQVKVTQDITIRIPSKFL